MKRQELTAGGRLAGRVLRKIGLWRVAGVQTVKGPQDRAFAVWFTTVSLHL